MQLLLFALGLSWLSHPHGQPLWPACGQSTRVSAYELDVRLEPELGRIEAQALVFIAPEDLPESGVLTFFLHGELRVESVSSGGRALTHHDQRVFYDADYSLVANRVTVALDGAELMDGLSVRYAGHFHPSRARSPSDYMRIDRDGVHLRAFGYSPWFPILLAADADSHPVAFLGVRIDTPAEFVPVFVGEPLDSYLADGRRISEWAAECELQQAQLTARRYRVTERDGLHLYALPDDASQTSLDSILSFVEAFEQACGRAYGPRPAGQSLHVLQMTAFGDIASGNVIGLSESSWRQFDQLSWPKQPLAHELVHDYVALRVPGSDPLHALVVEGFPSYFHLPILAELDEGASMERGMRAVEREYLVRRGAASADLPERPLSGIRPDQIGAYKDRFVLNDRALLFCDALRRSLGPEGFTALCRTLFAREQIDRTSFERLLREHLEEGAADVPLDTWLDTTDYPDALRLPR